MPRWYAFMLLILSACALMGACTGASKTPADEASPASPNVPPDASDTDAPPSASNVAIPSELGPLAGFGIVAAQVGPTLIGSDGGKVTGVHGVVLDVSPGALPADASITLTEIRLDFGGIDITTGEALAVVIESDLDVESFPVSVGITVPFPDRVTRAARIDGDSWIEVPIENGVISIDHFSTNILVVVTQAVEWASERLGDFLSDNPKEVEHRAKVEAADEFTQDFYGVGETTSKTHAELCEEIWTTLSVKPEQISQVVEQLPDGYSTLDIYNFLRAGVEPSNTEGGSELWKLTEPTHAAIRQRILSNDLATRGPLTPAKILEIAIEENDGNTALGMLAAHNVLKEVTYAGRFTGDPGLEGTSDITGTVSVKPEFGQLARQLEPWRRNNPWSPKGRYDKLGPLYHLFAAMVARVWSASPTFGTVAISGEAILRAVHWGTDSPDTEKAAADECGREIGDRIMAGDRVFKGPGTFSSTWEFHTRGYTKHCTVDADWVLTLKRFGEATLFISNIPSIEDRPNASGGTDIACVSADAQLYSGTWSGDRALAEASIIFGSTDSTFTVHIRPATSSANPRATAVFSGVAYTGERGGRTNRITDTSELEFVLEEVLPED